jgi:hypothetical protein
VGWIELGVGVRIPTLFEWGEIYGIRRKMSLEYTKFEGMNQVDVLMWRGR